MPMLIKVELPCCHKVTVTKQHLAHKVITCFQCYKVFNIKGEWRTEWSKALGTKRIRPNTRVGNTCD